MQLGEGLHLKQGRSGLSNGSSRGCCLGVYVSCFKEDRAP